MNKIERIEAFHRLGAHFKTLLKEHSDERSELLKQAYLENPWFTGTNVLSAIQNIASWLDEATLTGWLSAYPIEEGQRPKNIGVIMAGNIPLVGFHDLLSILISGHRAVIKYSHKDKVLMEYAVQCILNIEPRFKDRIVISDKSMKGIDAMIATGSNNSFRYFERYFGKMPHIFRHHRNGVAVITPNENMEDLRALAHDIFLYFGLGCRNVSKLYVIEGLNIKALATAIEEYNEIVNHHKYGNNCEYQRAIFQLGRTPFFDLGNVLLREDPGLSSPVGVLHYETVQSLAEARTKIERDRDLIQVTIGKDFAPFGSSQSPNVSDYADEVDILSFLSHLEI